MTGDPFLTSDWDAFRAADEIERLAEALAPGDGGEATAPGLDSSAPNPSLTAAVTDALVELDALHRVDPWADQCLTCGPADGSWPCVTRMVADDLRAALDGEEQIGHSVTDEQPARVATLPLDWQSRDGVDWFPKMDGSEVCLRLNSDGSVTWFPPEDPRP